MTRPETLAAILRHTNSSLFLADDLPRTPKFDFLRDALHRIRFELTQIESVDRREALP